MKNYFLKIFSCIFLSFIFIELVFKFVCFNNIFVFSTIRILLFSLSTSLFLSFIFSLLKELPVKILTCISTFIMGLYAIIETNFKSFMGNFMSLSMLSDGRADRVSNEVGTFFLSMKPYYFLYFLPFVVLIILFIWKKDWLKYEKQNLKNCIVNIGVILLVHVASLLTLYVSSENQLKSNKDLYKAPILIDVSLKEFGAQRFFVRDIVYFFNGKETTIIDIEKEEAVFEETDYTRNIDDTLWENLIATETNKTIKNLHEYYINQSITPKNDYTGMFKDKNLILIMVEAFDLAAIDPYLTPNIYRLTQEGWYFDNYYAPKFSCTTGESEFIALTSIIPSNSVCTPHTYVNNDYSTSIFNLFNESGYTSTSYHGWSDQYYPRTKLHKNMGSTFTNASTFGFSTAKGWTSDLEFFKKAYPMYKDNDKFFSFMITVSMHFTYDKDDATTRKNWNRVKDLDVATPMKRYLAKAIEFDMALEYLINSLEEDNKLEDTVIVLFGDHHPYNLQFSYLNDRSSVDRYQDLNEDLMPFIIYNPSLESKTISKTASTFDLLPTLANLFDLNYDPRYYIGTDIFSDEETIAIFPSGSWVTDKAVYFSSKNTFKLKDKTVSEEYIAQINKIVGDKFTASDSTLKKDYFKYRFPNSPL